MGVVVSFPALTTITNDYLALSGGTTFSLPNVQYIDGASFIVSGGVALVAQSSELHQHGQHALVGRLAGVGSVLDLHTLVSL